MEHRRSGFAPNLDLDAAHEPCMPDVWTMTALLSTLLSTGSSYDTGAAASAAFQAGFQAGGGSLGPWGNLGPEPSGAFAFNPLMSLNTLMKIGSMGSLGSLPPQQASEFHAPPMAAGAAAEDTDAGAPVLCSHTVCRSSTSSAQRQSLIDATRASPWYASFAAHRVKA